MRVGGGGRVGRWVFRRIMEGGVEGEMEAEEGSRASVPSPKLPAGHDSVRRRRPAISLPAVCCIAPCWMHDPPPSEHLPPHSDSSLHSILSLPSLNLANPGCTGIPRPLLFSKPALSLIMRFINLCLGCGCECAYACACARAWYACVRGGWGGEGGVIKTMV